MYPFKKEKKNCHLFCLVYEVLALYLFYKYLLVIQVILFIFLIL